MSQPPRRTFERIVLDRFEFPGLRGCRSWCRLTVVELRDGRTVVVASEREDNPGTSVTNAAEQLATAVVMTFCLDPDKLVWVEHYPAEGPHAKREDWDLVTFKIIRTKREFLTFTDPDWRPMRRADWQDLGLDPATLFLH